MGWLAGWSYRKKLTIASAGIDDTLTNFPILVSVTGARIPKAKVVSASGYDVVFTSSNGTTLLKHELVWWDDGANTGEFWVKIPSIASGTDTDFYVYYGKAAQGDTTSTDTWDANFEAVYHLQSGGTDSTSNSNDLTISGATNVACKIGKGYSFDGNDQLYHGATAMATTDTTRTIEAWGLVDNFAAQKQLINSDAAGTVGVYHTGAIWQSTAYSGGGWMNADGVQDATATWYHRAVTYLRNNGTGIKHYRNGVSVGTGATDNTNLINGGGGANEINIGSAGNGTQGWIGDADEVRYSLTVRTAAWLLATYHSGSDALITYGTEQALSTYTKTLTVDAILQKTSTKTLTADAFLQKTDTKTLTADAILVNRLTKTLTADAIIVDRLTKTLEADAILVNRLTKTLTADAILKKTSTKTLTANAILKATFSKTFTADAILVNRLTKTMTADAQLTGTVTKTMTADAILVNRLTKSLTADAFLQSQGLTKTMTANAILKATFSKTLTVDAYLQKQGLTKTLTADAYLQKQGLTKILTADAIIVNRLTKSLTADALLQKTQTKTLIANAILVNRLTKEFSADAILQKTSTKTLTADAIIVNRLTKSLTADAYLQSQGLTKTMTADAILIKLVKAKMLSASVDNLEINTKLDNFNLQVKPDLEV